MIKRQIDLLKKLIMEDSYKPMKYYCSMFAVSEKTISKDLNEIEQTINPLGITIDRKCGVGIKLYCTSKQLDQLNSILNKMEFSNNVDNIDERRTEIFLTLLINTNQFTTIQKLSDQYMVSRTSIINDLNVIQEKLQNYNLELTKTSKGTKVTGSEINIRNALVSIIKKSGKLYPDFIEKYQSLRHKELKLDEMNTMISKDSVTFFENLLNELENKLKVVINEPYYTNLLTHLIIMTNRILDGNCISDNVERKDDTLTINEKMKDCTIDLIRKIEKKFNIIISDEEAVYVYKYLTSIGLKYNYPYSEKESDLLPENFTRDLIDILSQMSGVNYSSVVGLFEKLMLHVKPMINRTKYNIQIKNPLLSEFLREFKDRFIMTKIACHLVCKNYKIAMINDSEVAYILSYFLSADEKIVKNLKIKTIVICHSGYGTSQLLATRLEKTFSNIEIVGVITSNRLQGIDLNNIDLIVSTVSLDIKYPYLVASAFLNEVDKKNINNYIETVFQNRRKVLGQTTAGDTPVEVVKIKDMKQIKKLISKENLISLGENIFIYVLSGKVNSVTEFIILKEQKEKYIFSIAYSDYAYLSRAVRKITEVLKRCEE